MARQPFSRQIQTRALSSVYGKIEQMLLAYPGGKEGVDQHDIIKRYGNLFMAFRDRVTFVVMGHFGSNSDLIQKAQRAFENAMRESFLDPDQQLIICHAPLAGGTVRKAKQAKPTTLQMGDEDLDHKDFIQDPFVVMETETSATVLLEPINQVLPRNAYVAEQLASQAGFLIQPTDLILEGGDILIGDDFALVGRNTLLRNTALGERKSPDKSPEKVEAWVQMELARLLGVRYLYWIGLKEPLDLGSFHNTGEQHCQPFFHIDLFLTLTGKTEDGEEGIAIGKIDLGHVKDANPEERHKLVQINEALKEIEATLQRFGKEVPGPRFKVVTWEMGGVIDRNGKSPHFIPYSYNNAHIESYSGISRAYFPRYNGFEALEKKIQSKLRVLNIQTEVFIDNDFEYHSSRHGSLHCLSKVLKRN